MFDEPSYAEIMRAQRRALAWKVAVVGLVLLLVLAASVHKPLMDHIAGWQHGDHDLLGQDRWSPPDLPLDPGSLEGLDLGLVHAELIPAWFIALANSPASSARVEQAFAALRAGVAADPQLAAVVVELHALVVEDPWANAERIFALVQAWNARMDALEQPWQLDSNVMDMGNGPFFYTKSYRVEAALSVPTADAVVPLRVLRRVDATNVREGYLGVVFEGQERALVVVDRVRDMAIDELWPLLDPGLDAELSEQQAAYAPLLREGVEQGLAAEQVSVLRATARARWDLWAVGEAIELRRACGSSLRVNQLPWYGLEHRELVELEGLARAEERSACPGITMEEVDRLRAATSTIRQREALEPALESLVAWAARATAVHELRHVADSRAHGMGSPPCGGCEAELGTAAAREASAYLASIAWSQARYAALLQACTGTDGDHAWAMAWLSERLGEACAAPPADLAARARVLEAQLFGAREPMVLPDAWPVGVPVR